MFRRLAPLALTLLVACHTPTPSPPQTEPPTAELASGWTTDFVRDWSAATQAGNISRLPALAPYCPTEQAAPYDASRLSVGLYWYAPGEAGAPGGVGCRAEADGRAIEGYYDPERPVLIFVHGWQPGLLAQGLIPGTTLTTRRENFWFDPAGLNVADFWLRSGWNVGFFHWSQLADESHVTGRPFNAQAKIWTAHYAPDTGPAVAMRWQSPAGLQADGPQQSAGELFYAAYKAALAQWTHAGEPVRVMGHSLGAQMVLALAEQAYRDPNLPELQLPRRLILADPYWTDEVRAGHHYGYLAPDHTPAQRSNRIVAEVLRGGGVVEWLKSSRLTDIGGDPNPELLKLISRTDIEPEYLSYGNPALGRLAEQHMVAPRWYLWTLQDQPQGPFGAARSLSEAGALMGERRIFTQRGGKQTPWPDDDSFVRGVVWSVR